MSAHERTGWRDQSISEWHREWGINCPAVDLDFVLLEYDRGEPCAVIDYKHERARPFSSVHPTMRAISKLATNSNIPFFIVKYTSERSFNVLPINDFAQKSCEKHLNDALGSRGYVSEFEFVAFLYAIRGRGHKVPDEVAFKLVHSSAI